MHKPFTSGYANTRSTQGCAKASQVCNLAALTPSELETVLAATPVNEVWGVGRQITKQLTQSGIHNVVDLVRLDPAMVKRRWSVMLERTVRELRGMPCIDLDHTPAPKQEIACTRSFGHPVTALQDLDEAVTEFASRAAHKLRKQGSTTSQVLVFIRTSPFRKDPQYGRSLRPGHSADGQCRAGRGQAAVGDEAGEKDAGVHHALGGYAGGAGVSNGKHASHARSCCKGDQ